MIATQRRSTWTRLAALSVKWAALIACALVQAGLVLAWFVFIPFDEVTGGSGAREKAVCVVAAVALLVPEILLMRWKPGR